MKFPHPMKGRSRKVKFLAATTGAMMAATAGYAATNWAVGLASNSTANAQGASIQSLTIADITAAPTLSNKLSPGGTGDVQFKLTNPNPFLVTVTNMTLPIESLTSNDALGYSDSGLSSAIAGCGATTSTVTWVGSGASQVSKLLSTGSGAFTIAAGATITVTLTNDAQMDTTSPLVCAGTSSGSSPNLTYAGAYFVMPALVTVTASGGVFPSQPTTVPNSGSVTTGW